MSEPKKSERIKLKVLKVKEVEKIGEKQTPKLPILAKNEEGQDYWYQCFQQPLFEIIQSSVDKIIECDVMTSVKSTERGEFTNRNIQQVYVNGQPVLQRQRGGGFSTEAAQILADAYLKATAIQEVGLIIQKKTSFEELNNEERELAKAYTEAIRSILSNGKPAGRSISNGPPEKPTSNAEALEALLEEEGSIKHLGDLLSRANNLDKNRNDVKRIGARMFPEFSMNDVKPEMLEPIWKQLKAEVLEGQSSDESFEKLKSASTEEPE